MDNHFLDTVDFDDTSFDMHIEYVFGPSVMHVSNFTKNSLSCKKAIEVVNKLNDNRIFVSTAYFGNCEVYEGAVGIYTVDQNLLKKFWKLFDQ